MTEPPVPRDAAEWALFLDVDGTLLDITSPPDAVRARPGTVELLIRLRRATGGALALISGRTIARLDEIFAPMRLPAAGLHGVERRRADGDTAALPVDSEVLRRIRHRLQEFADGKDGVLLEDKGMALAIHYRDRPSAEAEVERVVRESVAELGSAFHVQAGKKVFEIKPEAVDKGRVILDFLKEAPFAGRVAVFAGDDVTDEDGFRVVNELDGYSVHVGDSDETAARWRVDGVDELLEWLGHVAARGTS